MRLEEKWFVFCFLIKIIDFLENDNIFIHHHRCSSSSIWFAFKTWNVMMNANHIYMATRVNISRPRSVRDVFDGSTVVWCLDICTYILYIYILIGGFKHFLFSISYMGCHPSHWLICFKMVFLTTNQYIYIYIYQPTMTGFPGAVFFSIQKPAIWVFWVTMFPECVAKGSRL